LSKKIKTKFLNSHGNLK